MTTAVVYHTFAMPFSMQRGRPLKFVVYHRVVLGVKKQHYNVFTFTVVEKYEKTTEYSRRYRIT